MAIGPDGAQSRELVVHPDDLTNLGQTVRDSVKDLPAALQSFLAKGTANPAQFGNLAQDQHMGATYRTFCQSIGDIAPMLHDMIEGKGAAVQSWARAFADHDRTAARNITNVAKGGK